MSALAALLAIGGVIGYGHYRYEAGDKNGSNRVTVAWDADKSAIQKAADAQLAIVTKAKEDALAANEVIQNGYQVQLSAANANAADFAIRLRRAEANLAANRGNMPKASGGSGSTDTSSPTSADQLGQLVGLVTGLRTECIKNDAQLDSLIAQSIRQL